MDAAQSEKGRGEIRLKGSAEVLQVKETEGKWVK